MLTQIFRNLSWSLAENNIFSGIWVTRVIRLLFFFFSWKYNFILCSKLGWDVIVWYKVSPSCKSFGTDSFWTVFFSLSESQLLISERHITYKVSCFFLASTIYFSKLSLLSLTVFFSEQHSIFLLLPLLWIPSFLGFGANWMKPRSQSVRNYHRRTFWLEIGLRGMMFSKEISSFWTIKIIANISLRNFLQTPW